jgi:ribosomal protein S18 acetylase RimI-like enzyme
MNQPEVEIQALRPTSLGEVVEVHRLAFPNAVLTRLGAGAVRRYYEWQFVGPHDLVAVGARIDGGLVGFCFGGVFRGAVGGFVHRNRAYLIGRLLLRPWLVADPLVRDRVRVGRVALSRRAGAVPPPAGGAARAGGPRPFSILSIAVDPGWRGRGIGALLLARAEAEARQRGFERMNLTVHADNIAAIRLYERCGWRPLNPGTGGDLAMVKDLAS